MIRDPVPQTHVELTQIVGHQAKDSFVLVITTILMVIPTMAVRNVCMTFNAIPSKSYEKQCRQLSIIQKTI